MACRSIQTSSRITSIGQLDPIISLMGMKSPKMHRPLPAPTRYAPFRLEVRTLAPTVGALAAPTHALARPRTLERFTASEAVAGLGDVGAFRLRLRLVLRHPRRIPRTAIAANRGTTAATPQDPHRVPDAWPLNGLEGRASATVGRPSNE